MKGLIIEKPGKLVIRNDLPIPEVKNPEDVLIQVEACGVCGTDVHLYHGLGFAKYPVIPGHEFVGKVVKMGKKASVYLNVGDRVVIDPNLPCFQCEWCRKGYVNLCTNPVNQGINKDGAYAEYALVNVKQCYKISVSIDESVAILAEPLSCVLHGVDRSGVNLSEKVLIIGAGPIGIIFYKYLKNIRGIKNVSILEINPKRISLAKQIGVEDISHEPPNEYFDVIIEASGSKSGFELGINLLKPRGRLVQFGVPKEEVKGEIPLYQIYKKELQIIGSFVNPFTMNKAVYILEEYEGIFKGIVSQSVTLEEVKKVLTGDVPIHNFIKLMLKITD